MNKWIDHWIESCAFACHFYSKWAVHSLVDSHVGIFGRWEGAIGAGIQERGGIQEELPGVWLPKW